MNASYPRLPGPIAGAHPAVLDRRIRDVLLICAAGLIATTIAFGVTVEVPHPNPIIVVGIALGTLGIVALMVSTRYELTLALVALYLGLLEGPVKLGSGAGATASASRDILIVAISLGAIVRLLVRKERVKLPPLSGWVLAFVCLVLVQALNPATHGILKTLGGFRQQLEWIPFFFFGYVIMRSKERFVKFFILLGVIALINGLASTYQTRISPGQLAAWGPGYASYVKGGKTLGGEGTKSLTGRTYSSEGVSHPRPPALGSDEGFGGSVGTLALSGCLALLATGRLRRRWAAPVLCLGATLAIATSLQRTQVLGAVIGLLAFGLFSLSVGRRVTRPLAAILALAVMAFALSSVLSSTEGGGVFSRYTSIAPSNAANTSVNYRERTLLQIPRYIEGAPFGVGLGSVAAASGFGGSVHTEIEEHGITSESQYNFVTLELGLPGLLLWLGLSVKLLTLAVGGLRRIADTELRLYLAAVFATLVAFAFVGLAGPTMATSPFGPYFWFAVGIASYWLAGPGRSVTSTPGGT